MLPPNFSCYGSSSFFVRFVVFIFFSVVFSLFFFQSSTYLEQSQSSPGEFLALVKPLPIAAHIADLFPCLLSYLRRCYSVFMVDAAFDPDQRSTASPSYS
jgi:hypothetical protein